MRYDANMTDTFKMENYEKLFKVQQNYYFF